MENPTDDLRNALESAFESEETSAVETVIETSAPDGQLRDDAGKFASSEVVAQEAQADPVEVIETPDEPAKRAPSSWKPDAQLEFDKLPAHVQDEVLRREGDYHKGIDQYKNHAHAAQAYEKAVAPYMATIQQMGIDAPTAVAKLMQADHTMRYADPQTKQQYFANLAKEYGVDLTQVANPPAADPQYQSLQQQLAQNQWELQNWKAQQSQREQSQALTEIEKFSAEPSNVHFNAVRDDMATLLQNGMATSLPDAYEKAIWQRGDIRQSLIDQQRAEAQKKATDAAHHQRAKAASVSVKGSSPASSGVSPVKGSLRDQLVSAFADN